MVRNLLVFVSLLCFILSSCSSSKQALKRGDFNSAVRYSSKKLRKKPNKQKQIAILEEAFAKANQQNMDRITFLKKEGNPDNWDEIYRLYASIKSRQQLVKTLPRLQVKKEAGRIVQFNFIDTDDELIQAKKQAAEYAYANAEKLLSTGNKTDARKAYEELKQVNVYYNNYKNTNELMNQALWVGTTHVIVTLENNSLSVVPKEFFDEIKKLNLNEINRDWIAYDTNVDTSMNYDYNVIINLKVIDVSPEQVKETQYTKTKEIVDGWEYVLDDNGNVLKDSLGNDVKQDKVVTISCLIKEFNMRKGAVLTGTLDYINTNSKQLMRSEPLTSESYFEHRWATAIGDKRALDKKTEDLLKANQVPFPSDMDIIMRTGFVFRENAESLILRNRQYLN
ncbi:MAG: hypothetical protein HKO56_02145 [Bacteroidia bacterium]|nr:hypothetical protein [Bacteroidia bacterium]